jgi:hypothetical protein
MAPMDLRLGAGDCSHVCSRACSPCSSVCFAGARVRELGLAGRHPAAMGWLGILFLNGAAPTSRLRLRASRETRHREAWAAAMQESIRHAARRRESAMHADGWSMSMRTEGSAHAASAVTKESPRSFRSGSLRGLRALSRAVRWSCARAAETAVPPRLERGFEFPPTHPVSVLYLHLLCLSVLYGSRSGDCSHVCSRACSPCSSVCFAGARVRELGLAGRHPAAMGWLGILFLNGAAPTSHGPPSCHYGLPLLRCTSQ